MIILDIETSGVDINKNGIVSVGALCLDNPEQTFYQKCRLDDEDEIVEEAMKINGFNEEEMRDKNKQSQKELIEKFFQWIDKQEIRILAGHNVGFFDINFLKYKAQKYNIKIKTRYRSFDLCSAAQTIYFQIYGKFLLDDYKENAMGLSKILEFCGIPDQRIKFDNQTLVKEGKTHNALEDAKLEAECFSRLLTGKNLLPEFKKFPVPEHFKQ